MRVVRAPKRVVVTDEQYPLLLSLITVIVWSSIGSAIPSADTVVFTIVSTYSFFEPSFPHFLSCQRYKGVCLTTNAGHSTSTVYTARIGLSKTTYYIRSISQTMSRSMEEIAPDLDMQRKITRSCLEELSSSMEEKELSVHKERVAAEVQQQLKKATSHMQEELSLLKDRVAELEQQLKKATLRPEELSSHVQVGAVFAH